jgi:Rieske Fe-S protein
VPALPRPDAVLTRRALIASAGLATAALGGLSACGGSDTPAAGAAPSAAAGPVTAKTSEIPVGGGKIFPDAATVITQPTSGTFKAFSSICTHAGCPVAAVTSTIDCNCHGSKFSLTDGSPVNGPATVPLPARTVQVSSGSVKVSG